MHWTSFLAYRRFPANARVADDVACIHCGYNLRSQSVWARCPECGYEVGHSIFLLPKSGIVARSLRTAGTTYLAPLLALLMCFNPGYWPLLIVSGANVIGGVFRTISITNLRFRGALHRLPVVGQRLQIWWLVILGELLIDLAWLVAVLAISGNPSWQTPQGQSALAWLAIASWAITLLSAVCAGRFGYALTDMLGAIWLRVEFRIQTTTVIFGAVLSIPLIYALTQVSLIRTLYVVAGLLGAIVVATMIATSIPLLQAATAAEVSRETLDEVMESDRIDRGA